MSSTVSVVVHACYPQVLGKVSRVKSGSLGPIPMIHPPVNSSYVALQYETRA